MRSNYRPIGDYIELVDTRNVDLKVKKLLGLSISKQFIPSVANTVGTNMRNYKIIRKNQFACSTMQVRRDRKMPVALLQDFEEAIISQAYPVFEIVDTNKLVPEYLMMWFSRAEFDRHAEFLAVGGVRGTLEWEDFLNMELPVPSLEKQQEIVNEYNIIADRIQLNERLNQKLEATAQALYKHWFVDFEFPNENGQPYKFSGGAIVYNEELDTEIPEGWEDKKLGELCEKIASGSTPKGGKQSYQTEGISLIRSMNVYDNNFLEDDLAHINYKQATKLSNVEIKDKDILINITGASVARCCIVPSRILPARVNQHVMIIRPPENLTLNNYLLYVLYSEESKRDLIGVSEAGSTRQAITKTEIEDFRILKPKESLLIDFDKYINPIKCKRNDLDLTTKLLAKMKTLLLSKMATAEENEIILL